MNCKFFHIFLIISTSWASAAFAQEQDTIWVQGKSILILGDSSVFIDRDTVLVIPDSVASFLKQDSVNRNNRFYKKLKKALYTTKLTAEIYDLLIDESEQDRRPQKKKKLPSNNYYDHLGKLIGSVKITKLAVFGTDINDTTTFKNHSWILKQGNSLHNYTRSRVIRNHLFFSEGELLDPIKLQDSERTLRSLPYIKDARVIVNPVSEDVVDIIVVVQDNWSITPALSFSNFTKWRLVVDEENFLGFGHELNNTIIHDRRDTPAYGYLGLYRIRNIGNSFINTEITFAESHDYTTRGIRIFRDYITPDIELAGGVEISVNGRNTIRVLPDTVVDFDTKYQFQDVWLSHAYPVGSVNKRKRLVTGARFVSYNFLTQPEVSIDSNYQYFSRDQYLFTIGLSRRNYQESSLIYGFGRTEDIPVGQVLSVTVGKEYNQFSDRWYGEGSLSIGRYVGSIGYFRPTFTYSTFMDSGDLEQGLLRSELLYFSHLYYLKRFAFRQFFYVNYTRGFNRFGNEYIDINNNNGIRGLSSIELLGAKRFTFRSETLSFTPFYIIGFRMAIFGFVDLGAIQPEGGSLHKTKFYQGFGLGFRFRNEHLAFKSVSIRFGYYPNAPDDASPYNLFFAGQQSLRYNDFIVEPPSVEEFR